MRPLPANIDADAVIGGIIGMSLAP